MILDLILHNGVFLTQDSARPLVRQIGIFADQIVALEDECEGLQAKAKIDLEGATVLPGFNDAHAHSVWFGHTLLETNLAGCTDLEDLYSRVENASRGKDRAEWVVCSGFNQMDTDGLYPDAKKLASSSGGRPVYIKHTSGHSCFIDQTAIELLGITGAETISGGSVVLGEDGLPTGLLEETAMSLVQSVLLPASDEQIVAALHEATKVYVSEGLTSVSDAGIGGGWIGHSPREFAAYQQALAEKKLLTRMQPMLVSDVLSEVRLSEQESYVGLVGGMASGFGDNRLQLGPVKIFLDGSILGNTAKLSSAYSNCAHNHGYFQNDPAGLEKFALEAARAGWSLAMHAVGDEAIDLAIKILQQLHDEGVKPRLPHRLEHGGVVYPEQLAQLARLGVTIVAQPYFMSVYGDGFREYIGDERAEYSFRMASLLNVGLPVAGSSDRPVAEGAPLKVIQAAVSRETKSGFVYGPAERLSIDEAIYAYTAGSAEVTGWGQLKGKIKRGFLADLVVLESNPLETAVQKLADIKVLATLVGAEAVYDPENIFGAGA